MEEADAYVERDAARTAWTPCFWPRRPARRGACGWWRKYSTGFVYLVSRTGVTGERESLSESVAPLVEAVRAVTDLPLAVGFGISRPEHVAAVGSLADAVVVGSAFVRLIEQQRRQCRRWNSNWNPWPASSSTGST